MKAVIVSRVLAEDCFGEADDIFLVSVLRYVFILVIADHQTDGFNLATPDRARDNRSISKRLDERWPPSHKNHVTHILVEAVVGGPVEDTHINSLLVVQLLTFHLCALDYCPVTLNAILVDDLRHGQRVNGHQRWDLGPFDISCFFILDYLLCATHASHLLFIFD